MKKAQFEHLDALDYSGAEAINTICSNLSFAGRNLRKIVLTSCNSGDGKSYLSLQIARNMAQRGLRVILVDCDLRKSVLKDRMQFYSDDVLLGLDYYLSGLAEYENVVYETNVENAYIVPCTQILQNPSSLFEDTRFNDLFDLLEKDFDYIVVDSPPLISVSDGALIASLCDGAILVVRSGETPRPLVKQSLMQLERSGCRLLGTVLNGAKVSTSAYGKYGKYYGKYYNKYYSKYYGDYYGNNSGS